ncbi:MAG: DUF3450 domain-containing protein [Arenicella sp.]|nr:DUF3450 domain-containing protein [Arenicella sp.]
MLNWIGRSLAIVAFSSVAVTTVLAQSIDEDFARELKLVEGLKVYNDQLQKQLDAQQKAQADIRKSIANSKDLEPQIVPLLNKMLGALEQFIRADLPFHMDDRMESISELKSLMLNSEASNSDRFRNIMDIYTVETEYGNTYEAYPGTVVIEGVETPVDMLRVGRLGLYYQTKDQKQSGRYDMASKSFQPLPDSANRDIRKAIKIAAKTIAPELMSVPISAPEGV